MQIIDTRQLSAEDNIWLKSLDNDLNRSAIELIASKIAEQGKSARIDAYAYAVACAYFNKMEEKYMTSGITSEHLQAFEDRFRPLLEKTGFIAKCEARGEARSEAKWTSVVADKDAEIARLQAELEANRQ